MIFDGRNFLLKDLRRESWRIFRLNFSLCILKLLLAETERIVGTTKFFGEIWKTMLRTPRCRLSAIKYLDRKIPRSIQIAHKLVKDGKIFISPYHYEIKLGRVQLADNES